MSVIMHIIIFHDFFLYVFVEYKYKLHNILYLQCLLLLLFFFCEFKH